LNSVERFDLDGQVWTYVTSMSSQRSTFGLAVLNNNLYAIGGRDSNVCLNSVERYSPLTNKWYPCASMNKKRGAVAVTTLNNFIYAIGGHEITSTSTSTRYDCAERYDLKLDQWSLISNISRQREAIGITNVGTSYIYIVGGYDGHKTTNECEKYDPIKNEWTKVNHL
jgi:N-acetylneuraminic acid mutarotase